MLNRKDGYLHPVIHRCRDFSQKAAALVHVDAADKKGNVVVTVIPYDNSRLNTDKDLHLKETAHV